jgi:hypothetical protein
MTNDDITRRTKVFRFWVMAWFAMGLGMALSISVVPLMVAFAIGHFATFPIMLYYAIKLSNEIWKGNGGEGNDSK